MIVTCAVTGGGDTVGKHPAIPVTPEEIANAALEARAAGDGAGPIHGRHFEIQAQLAQHIAVISTSVLTLTMSCGAISSSFSPA